MAASNNATTIIAIAQTSAGKSVKTKTIDAGKAVFKAKAGEHYSVVDQNNGQHLANLIATKVGNHLILDYANGVQITIEDYFSVCENDACTVTVAGEDAAAYQIAAETEGVAVDGGNMIYAYGDKNTLMAMAKGNAAMSSAFVAAFGDLAAASETGLPEQGAGSAFWAKAASGLVFLGAGGMAIHQAIDSDSDGSGEPTIIQGNISGGPVIAGNGLTVTAYAADGRVLGASSVEPGSTSYTITITEDYIGSILLKVTDADDGNDYIDEATNTGKDLNADLRAATSINGAGTFTININDLTELAVRELGLAGGDGNSADTLGSISAEQINTANQNVAAATGLTGVDLTGVDLIDDTVELIIDETGAANPAANDYGQVLAAISGIEHGASISKAAALDQLAAALTETALTDEAKTDLVAGAEAADADTFSVGENLGVANPSALANAWAAVHAAAAGAAEEPSLNDLLAVGIKRVTADNLPVIQAAIAASADDATAVDTIDELQTLVTTVVAGFDAAKAVIAAYADDNTQPAPTVQDYIDAGITGVNADNLNAVNAGVAAVASADVDTVAKIQAIVDADFAGSITAITGTVTQGQTLEAGTITDADGGVTGISYQWQADGSDIDGATAATYTLTQAEVGKTITVVATYTDNEGSGKTATSAATAAVVNIDDAGSITAITGTATQGQTLEAGTITDADGGVTGISYQWQADGSDIDGATAATYTLTQAEVGKTITVVATYTDNEGSGNTATSAATAAVANIDDAGSISAITGTLTQGGTLTAGTITDADGGVTGISYQWQADGSDIDGATGATYTLTQAEIGKTITVVATYTDNEGSGNTATSAATAAVANIDDAGSISAITGMATQGQTLMAGTITDADGGVTGITYQWQADGSDIDGATGATYTLTQAEVGKTITVVATYTDNEGSGNTATSAPTAAVANINDPASISAITGTLTQGGTLTAGTITDADGTTGGLSVPPSYEWRADGVAIAGATNSNTYTLTQAEVGKAITVEVSYTDAQGTSETITSAATAAVVNINDPGSITITGTLAQGGTLTAGITDADGTTGITPTYVWRADGVVIRGATNSNTYTLTQAEVGKVITVEVSYTDALGTPETITSAPTAAVTNVNEFGSISAITGTLTQGETLTVGTITDADGTTGITPTYVWKADGVAITGATSNTYTLTQAEVGKAITVEVSYVDAYGTSERVSTSATPTAAVVNINDEGSISAITGTLTQGQTLTAGTIIDADGTSGGRAVAPTYVWKADDVTITGATSNSYTLTQAEVGKAITVEASYIDAYGTSETVSTSATPTEAVANINDDGSISAITGTVTQGGTLTAGTITDADGTTGITPTYVWKADDVVIRGATNSNTYTLTQAEVGKAITVEVSYTDALGTPETITSAPTAAVTNVNELGSISAITGTLTQGETLTAGTITDADGTTGITPTYVWKADGVAITGATSNTYTLTQAEVGKAITVEASYIDAQGTSETVSTSATPTAAVVNINDEGSISAITGTLAQGETLTAGTITDADGTSGGSAVVPRYVWKADGVVISGATSNTYTLTQAEVGKAITVEASYIDAYGTSETVSTSATPTAAVVNINDEGSISAITGTLTQGQTLTAGTIIDADGTSGGRAVAPTYVWKADNVTITGATSNTYTLTQAEVGKAIIVEASYIDAYGTSETVSTSATPTEAVANVDDPGSISAITGRATQGETLMAGTITDADGGVTGITYQWRADGSDIDGATAATYTLTQAEVGKIITVVATYTDNEGSGKTATSVATTAVGNINDPGSITITGTLAQGGTLTAGITDADGTTGGLSVPPSYEWRADNVAIAGATNSNTYTLTQAEVGKVITVEVSYTDAQGTSETITSAPTAAVTNVNDPGSITITGTLAQGGTLTAGITDADGTTGGLSVPPSYEWRADGVAIAGATNSNTYTLTQAEVGKVITVEVSYTDAQGTPETITSAPTAAVTNVNEPGSISAIEGTATQGQILMAGTISDADGTTGGLSVPPSYEWRADGMAIAGATNSNTYTLTQAEVGKAITVEASYTDAQGTSETITSAPTAAVTNINDPGSITITGTLAQGGTLTAGITDADGTTGGLSVPPSYEWRADGVAIAGATNSNTYTLTQAEVGKVITVEVSYTDAQGTSETITSAPTEAVANINDPGSITITGTLAQGGTLTAGITDADGTTGGLSVPPSYEWRADGMAIAGATNSNTYTLTQAEVGKAITVEVSYTDAQGTSETITSAPTAAVTNINDPGSITITGTLAQGGTLTAGITDADGTTGGLSVPPSYEWRADGVAIAGATNSNTYTLTQAEVGKVITVEVSYTDALGTPETITSAPTAAVTNVNELGSISAITGTLTQGETLTAGTITDADGTTGGLSVPPSYEWRANGVAIAGATNSNTYTLTQAEVGKAITVEVSYTDALGTPETITSAPTATVTNINDPGSITITGTLAQGGTLTAGITDADGTTGGLSVPPSYEWRANGVAIAGATNSNTYTLTQAEVGKVITVEARYTDAQGTLETITSAPTAAVTNVNEPGSISAIEGMATQGQILMAGTITDADGTTGGLSVPPSYEWRADGVAIAGATNSNTYTLTQAEVGKVITVEVSYTDAQGTPETITSAPTAAVTNVNDPGSITITGTLAQGGTLTAGITDADGTTGGLSVPPSYEWRANGVAIAGATNSNTYTLTQAEVGKVITVEVSYTDALGTPETITSAPTAAVTNVNEPGSISAIEGTATQGQILMAGTITDADGTTGGLSVPPSYEWRADGEAIAGATNSNTYTLTQAEVGKVITVEVSYTDAQGTPETITSAPTAAVANINDPGSITITGTLAQGGTLTAGTITDADGTTGGLSVPPSYEWRADGVAIAGATNSNTYILTQAEVGKAITVEVSYTDAQGTSETITSAPTAAVANINEPGSISAITGTATQGQTLTAGTITDADGTSGGSSVDPSYVWRANDVVIIGATSNTYILTQAEVGKVITVEVSYTDAQGTSETITSAPTEAVGNINDPGSISAITGRATQGETLTAGTITDADGTTGGSSDGPYYRWEADGVFIHGAIAATYTLTQAEVGKAITVEVRYVDAYGARERVTSAATEAVANINDPASISAITGTATQGQTLMAGTITDADGTTGGLSVPPSYEWRADGEAIAGATNSNTYTLTQAEVGKVITVEVSYTDAQGTPETITSAPTAAVANINDPGSITITGTLAQGGTLTAGITDADGTSGGSSVAPIYQWRADNVAIRGATAATYTLTQAEVGKAITVDVRYRDALGTTETVTSAPTAAVVNVDDPGSISAITGTAAQGQTLRAGTITDADAGVTGITYQWQADGSDIGGATLRTYRLTQAEVGKTITVVATYTDNEGGGKTATSAATAAVTDVNEPGSISAITGTLVQGETLTAGTITDADGTSGGSAVAPTYVWRADNVVIIGATSNTYTLTQAEVGKVITVEVSYTDAQGTSETITSAPTAAVANINDPGSITITGTLAQGGTLTAGTITDADGTTGGLSVPPSYEWRADGVAIAGATNSNTYILTQAEVGKAITVEVSYTDAQGTSETITSAPTAAVANINDPGSITITGTLAQGGTLTAGTISDADGTTGGLSVPPSYEWRADGVAIAGATAATYILTQAEVGKVITVEVSYTDAYGMPETITSAPTAAVANINDPGSITITGTLAQGGTLTAGITDADGTTGGLSVPPSYEWRADGVAIAGATNSNTYTLTQAEVGKVITVEARYTDAQGTLETITSAPTAAVTNVNEPGSISAIEGMATQGQILMAGTITDADGTTGGLSVPPSYEWRADGVAIAGATNSNTYTLTQAEVGKVITVEVSYTDAQGTPETITSAPTAAVTNVNDPGSITITGTLAQGGTLTAGITDADGTTGGLSVPPSYEWRADGVAIAGATNSNTYTLTQAEVGKVITVEVSYTDAQGTPETITSAPTAAVTNVNEPGSISAIEGMATQGQILMAGTITDADGTTGGLSVPPSYEWRADGVAIAGATNSNTYTLTQAEVGKVITVEARYTDALGTSETITSAPTAAVANINDPGSITITGTLAQGGTLTAGTITDADGTTGGLSVPPSYEWRADGVAIAGATNSNTYTLTQAEVGKVITVEARYTDAQGTLETITSAPTAAVTNVNEPGSISAIEGMATQGQTLTAGTITDADGTTGGLSVPPSYEWRADGVAIAGATNSNTYTLTQAEVGKAITVEVSYTDAQGTSETITSAPTAAVTNINDPGSISAIEGMATQGQILMAGTITDADGTTGGLSVPPSYEWRADGVAIAGATNSNTYTLTQAEVGKVITVEVSYTDAQGTPETITSAPTAAVANINDPGSITITGTLAQGGTLTAGTITDADGTTGGLSVPPSYEWRADGVAIAGATNSNTYILTQAEVGKAITVEVSYTDAQGTSETITSAPTAAVANINDPGSITITGTLAQGGTLTAGTISDADGTTGGLSVPPSYEWRADGVAIAGATAATYILTQAEVGKVITVEARYTDAQGTLETITSAPTAAVTNVNEPGSISAIEGMATQGQILMAGTITDADGTTGGLSVPPSYEWRADGVAIAGATNSNTYILTQAEVGKVITVEVSYTDAQGTSETITSAPTAAVANINDPGSITITGTLAQGGTLTAGTITDADGTTGGLSVPPSYEWRADGEVIAGATNSNTYTLTQAEVGKVITVEVSYTDALGTPETITSAPTTAVANINDPGSITITGTLAQGGTLTAGITDADGTTGGLSVPPSYEWRADGVAIAGATNSNTYTLTQAEVGKVITVEVSYTDAQGTPETITSAPTAAVTNVNDPGSITITGTLAQGGTLTAGITDADGTTGGLSVPPSYEWRADGVAIAGATNSNTYTLTQAEVGKVITVEVSYTDAQGTPETITSAPTAAVTNVNEPGSISAIEGMATQGQILMAGTITDADGTTGGLSVPPSYEWRADGVAIAGATNSNTYTLTQAEVGKVITVEARYTDALGTSETITSAPTAAVANINDPGSITITGTLAQGGTLTAGTITDADGTTGGLSVPPSYEWRADGVAIAGATNSNTYTLTQAEVGKVITVEARYTDAQGTLETITSAPTAAVTNVNEPGSISAIEGMATQGQILMAGTITDADGTTGGLSVPPSYEWRADGVAIAGATNSNTYTLTQAEVGKVITVEVSYTDAQGTPETITSAPTAAVTNVNDPGSITITGTLAQGGTLTAGITDADGTTGGLSVPPSYEWRADGVAIAGATNSNTYTLTQAEVGKVITVEVSYTDAQGTPETITSAPTAAVTNVNEPGSISAIEGMATQGQILMAGTITDADGTTGGLSVPPSYEWRADGVAIAGATNSNTYTLTQAEVGKVITVEARYTDALGTSETITSAPTAAVANINDPGSITITGTLAQGGTLTAGTITDADGTTGGLSVPPSYEWRADGVAIAGATNSNTYTLTQAEVGKVITVEARYTDAQGTLETITSAPTAAVTNVNEPGSISAIEGMATQGQILMAGTITDADGTTGGLSVPPSYEWRADGVAIAGATNSNTYILTQAEVGKVITVEVSYTDAQGTSETITSAPTAAVANTNDPGSISAITGTLAQGGTLTAGTISDADGTTGGLSVPPSYEWRADGEVIAGATNSNTYTLTQAEVGKVITVEVSYTDAQGTPETITSAPTAAVTNINDPGSITITGTLAQGGTLTAGTISDADGTTGGLSVPPSYEWRADGVAIAGATSNTYILTQAEVGKVITVEASYTDAQGTSETITSAATTAVANIDDAGSISAIEGTVTQGQTLEAGTITDADGGVTGITYQWRADGIDIDGATAATYTLTQAEVGKIIRVVATYTDNEGSGKTATSAVTAAVANIDDAGSISAITGMATQGETLMAGTITDADGGVTGISYQWQADGIDIDGAALRTYTLTQAEVGKIIRVVATYTDNEGSGKTATSVATAAVANTDDAGSISAITGRATQGQTLTAGTITDADGGVTGISYQWRADGIDIDGATGDAYTLTQAEVDKIIRVVATYTDNEGSGKTATSAATTAVANIDDAGSISAITGMPTQGETLMAGTITDADGGVTGITYQWQADGSDIDGATADAYTLTQAEVGKAITVEARYTDAYGITERVTSAPTAAVVGALAFNNKVTTVYVAENVATASAVYDAQAGVYQERNDSDITYTISGSDSGAFNIDTATGELRFVAVPDFEIPADADTDNSYELSITATHTPSGQSVDQAVTINVLNQNVHGAQLTAYTRTTADTTPVLEGTGPAGATITVGFAGATYEVVANRFGSWRIDTETAIPTSGSLTIDIANGAAGTWNAITLSATVEGETLNSVGGITIDTDASATDTSAFHMQTYADGTASADGTANDIDYEAYNGDEPSTQNAILIGKSELEYISNAALIALGEAGIAALTWEQVASLSPEQLSALHDENLLDNFNFGSDDKPSMILNAITGTDIISEQEMAEGFTVKIDGSGFADATVKLLLDNDRGSWDAPDDEATELVDYTLIGEGTADASGHLDFIFENGAGDGDNTNTTIGTDVLSGGSLTKKFTVWNDLNDDGIIDIDAGETAERVFYTADGTASMEDAIANPGINYSILDPITGQAFVYFYGDIDHGPQNGVGRDDMDGFQVNSQTGSGFVGNFAADLYEFHVNSLASEGGTNWQTSQDRANDQNLGGLLGTSASARALSFEQLGAFIAANFDNNAAGSNPDVLDYIRDNAGFAGNFSIVDDISGLAGWQGSAPSGWDSYYYWTGTDTVSGHIYSDLNTGEVTHVFDFLGFNTASVL